MFERYTVRARRVLFFARYEASQLGSISIETEHLLLGLIREGLGSLVKVPHFEGGAQLKALAPSAFYATTGVPIKYAGEIPPFLTYLDGDKIGPLSNLSEDLTLAARNALIAMIDYMVATKGLTPEQAYIVSSVAVDLRIGQMVDVPNYIVSAVLPLTIFRK